jgi:multicomponent Na+:H+ antiporter subunit G
MDATLFSSLLDYLSYGLLAIGSLFIVIGGVGVLRMPDIYTRMHASSITETTGSLFILAGLMLFSGASLSTIKLAAIALFLLFTSPVSSYALVNTALFAKVSPRLSKPASETPGS